MITGTVLSLFICILERKREREEGGKEGERERREREGGEGGRGDSEKIIIRGTC